MEWINGKLHLTIKGQPVSMKNSRKIIFQYVKGRKILRIIKGDKAQSYALSIERQVPILRRRIKGPIRIFVKAFYPDRRQDLDCELIFDALEKRIYVNDRQLQEKFLYRAIDKQNPRAEIVIEPLEPELNLC
ncbi:RusA family crossover junction endodeoxyribonuclease [Terasakiella pusilla]|uniref:RusA family crossover junction endodeoxyribonuclease n=1 Tax=Terasakiella pusilla TaxID=64973 RepID=UPI003AA81F84